MRHRFDQRWAAAATAALAWVLATAPADAVTGVYGETGGIIALEAEDTFRLASGSNGRSFQVILDNSLSLTDYRGGGYLAVSPDTGSGAGDPAGAYTGPVASYFVNFTTPGTYRLWTRSTGPDFGGDSVYARLFQTTPGNYYQYNASVSTSFNNTWRGVGRLNNTELTGSEVPATFTVAAPGLYQVQLLQREDGVRVDSLILDATGTFNGSTTGPAAASPLTDPIAFIESAGRVAVEAEHYASATSGATDSFTIEMTGAASTPRNNYYVRVGPNNLQNNTSGATAFDLGPTLTYQVDITNPGTYRAWMRLGSNPDPEPTGNDDSVWVRVFKDTPGDFYLMSAGGTFNWTGSGNLNGGGSGIAANFNLDSAGIWTVQVAMREDGTDIDAFMLENQAGSNLFTGGSGLGPAESAFRIIPEPAAAMAMLVAMPLLLARRR